VNALAAVVNMTGPWAIHMACVAISAAVIGRSRRMAAAIPLSFLVGSAIAFVLSSVSWGPWFYWSDFFWEPVFRRTPVSLDGEDAMGLVLTWLLPLAASATVVIVVTRLRTASTEQGSSSR
jgi:hypothetical protein